MKTLAISMLAVVMLTGACAIDDKPDKPDKPDTTNIARCTQEDQDNGTCPGNGGGGSTPSDPPPDPPVSGQSKYDYNAEQLAARYGTDATAEGGCNLVENSPATYWHTLSCYVDFNTPFLGAFRAQCYMQFQWISSHICPPAPAPDGRGPWELDPDTRCYNGTNQTFGLMRWQTSQETYWCDVPSVGPVYL